MNRLLGMKHCSTDLKGDLTVPLPERLGEAPEASCRSPTASDSLRVARIGRPRTIPTRRRGRRRRPTARRSWRRWASSGTCSSARRRSPQRLLSRRSGSARKTCGSSRRSAQQSFGPCKIRAHIHTGVKKNKSKVKHVIISTSI